MDKYALWMMLVTRFAGIVMAERGKAPRELAYLTFLTNGVSLVVVTGAELAELEKKYEAERGKPFSSAEVNELADRIESRSGRIQGA